MKLTISEQPIGLEDVECKLNTLRDLFEFHFDYFMWSEECVKKEQYRLINDYRRHAALVEAMVSMLDNVQEMLSMVQKNYISR